MAKRHSTVSLQDEIDRLTVAVSRQFRTFGGGRAPTDFNPITHWTKNEPAMFALGVDVAAVVTFVLQHAKPTHVGQTEATTRRASDRERHGNSGARK